MRVLNYGGAEQYADIPAASGWTQVTINNVHVTNGKATVAFSSIAGANQWLLVDDVSFSDTAPLPPAEYQRELEAQPVSVSAGDSQTNYTDSVTGATFNALNANAAGDYAQYTINVPQPGTYAVYVKNRVASNKGIYQLSVNGINVGTAVDQYAAASGYTDSSLGNVTISAAGIQTFRFTVTGKNAASSSYSLGLDNLTLIQQ